MKFLLLGKGKTIESIKKYLKYKKQDYVQAVFDFENKSKKYREINEQLINESFDFAIKSPGIHQTNQMYLKLSLKIKFISELDLLTLFKENIKSIVITGSNGKTTLCSMLYHIFKKSKIKSIVCGNSFEPLSSYYKYYNKDYYFIIEQSSYQLHNLKMYNPFISVILNMHSNHIDSSYSKNTYYENKKNIYKYQTSKNYFIYDVSNQELKNMKTDANVIDLLTYNKMPMIHENLKKYSLQINYIYTILKILSLNESLLLKVNTYKPLKYREEILKKKDCIFINDSKSTSIEATMFAISHIENKNQLILIIGGILKTTDLKQLNDLKIKHIICYGQLVELANKEINNVIRCVNLENAFKVATNIYLENKIILFSPATSSFDQFKNYIERGKKFEQLVKKYES